MKRKKAITRKTLRMSDKAANAFTSRMLPPSAMKSTLALMQRGAKLFDEIDKIPKKNPDAARYVAIALTSLETAMMFAIKGHSRSF